jgi:N-acetylglutamate synthase-like GNAT family acetyltransferase/ferredoxin
VTGTPTGARPRLRTEVVLSRGGTELIDATFRGAEPSDVPAMHALSEPFAATGELLARDRDTFTVLIEDFQVVEIDGSVVACAGIRRYEGIAEIVNVAVDARWQGVGLGRFLLASMLVLLRAEGFPQAAIFSKTAVSWFGRYGFVPLDPSSLPDARLTAVDPGRGSVLMGRPTVQAEDGVDALPQLTPMRVRFRRSGVEHSWQGTVDALLPFAEKNGVEVQSLCWGGVCGTCATRLLRGTVNYHVQPEVEPPPEEILLCISRPVTDLELDL